MIKQTPGFSPPVASRAIGYSGITLYESVVSGMPEYRSLDGQLNGLGSLPRINPDVVYHWPTCANTALAFITRKLFSNASQQNLASLDSLESAFNSTFHAEISDDVYNRSVDFGREIATSIYNWSTSDGGHEGQFHNTDPTYVPPVGPGFWEPTPPAFATALQPHWGKNRPFLNDNVIGCQPIPHPVYSTANTSLFYSQALEVYAVWNKLTQEERDMVIFWADGTGTYTPPGHSIAITTQVLNTLGSKLDISAVAFAKVGIAVTDAFISCWKTKYDYNLLRPITYIREFIDPTWSSHIATPPFPEYSSGHSVQSGAAAQVLSDMFGFNVSFTDTSHNDLGYAPRSFLSFFDFANEAAMSRMYGGIHFRAGIEKGVTQGIEIGRNVSAINFMR